MISVDSNYTNLRSAGASVEWQIVNGANTYTTANLISGKISAGYMENVSIGNCISAELDLELWGVTVDSSNPLVVQFRADGGTTWYTKGTFYIDTLEKNPYNENTTVKAFDAMLKTEVGYMASGVWANPTDEDVVDDIATDLGVTVESATATALNTDPITLSNAPHIGENGTTDREMLSYIAMLRGGNWVITSANELKLICPSTTPTNTAQVDKAVVNFAASETLTVSKVKVNVDSETYYLAPSNITEDAWKALAGYCIEIDLPFYGTQTVADDLLTQYDTKTFVPFQAEGAYVDPKYEVGDGVRFQKDSTYYTSVIANQTIDISWLCPSDLYLKGEEKLDSLYPYLSPRERQTLYQFGELEDAVDTAQSAANAAQASADGANYREQIIYISKVSGTNTVSANTTWVTDATGNQNTWTTTRPVYSSSYPVLFVATQRQSVSQSGGTTCTCTTPVKDQTTTVIDGGHITTGTIDASVVNVTNINASNINTGTLNAINITGSTITGSTLTSATSSGSVQIANGNINFYKNATTTGTPFSQMKHISDSLQGDSIEWSNSGYTKIVNSGGGQWTADFLQFAQNASNPSLKFLIYTDDNGTMTEFRNTYRTYFNGGQIYANKAGGGDNAAIAVRNATADVDACISIKDTRLDREIEMLVGGTTGNRGLYVRDANYTGWILSYNDTNITLHKPVAFSNAAETRANLGLGTWWLASGVGTTETLVTSSAGNFSSFICLGVPSSNYQATCVVPKATLGSTASKWQIADEQNYIGFELRLVGSNLYAKVAASSISGKTVSIYGQNGS